MVSYGIEEARFMLLNRLLAAIVLTSLCGCAVVKTTDVTDSYYKRHRSISILGWPLYSRVTDQDRGLTAPVATSDDSPRDVSVRAAELLGEPLELTE